MLWGAFNNATQAMMATSWGMGSISQNIANVNTVGYKHKESLFKTVLSETHSSPNNLDIFTVKATDRTHIQSQGVVTPTHHWSDLAINGRGFFMVAPPQANGAPPTNASTADPNAVLYSRAGQFQQMAGANGRNYLVTGSGHHLMGWAYDPVTQAAGTTLEPVYTQPQTVMPGRATTSATIMANLPAGNTAGDTAHTTTMSVTDGNGVARDMTLNWARVDGQNWTVTPSFAGGEGTATGSFNVAVDPFTRTATMTPAAPSVGISWNAGYFNPLVPATATATTTVATPGNSPSFGQMEKIYLPVYDAQYKQHTVALGFERTGSNEWYMHTENGTSVPLQFDGQGQMVTASPIAVSATFTNPGPPVTTTTQAVSVDLSKLSQYDGSMYLGEVDQDGYGEGRLRRADFNAEGDMIGSFDNGETLKLFRVPVATFVAENNLNAISGTLFSRTLSAGDLTVSAVQEAAGGGSSMTANSVENSTVDIEDEFTKMIMTQKAYSTNATVFRTADEMTTTARDLKS